jgi:hypothetical protein
MPPPLADMKIVERVIVYDALHYTSGVRVLQAVGVVPQRACNITAGGSAGGEAAPAALFRVVLAAPQPY